MKKVIISDDITIKQALKEMDKAGEKILIAVDSKFKLLGMLSDGDIRRWILKGKALTYKVSNIINRNPIYFKQGPDEEKAKEIMLEKKISCIPVVDENMKLVSVIWWTDLFEEKAQKKTQIKAPVILMAGGKGKRLSPITHIIPKPLVPVGEKAIIELIMDEFEEYGCKHFILSVNYKANLIKAYFSDSKPKRNVQYIEEDEPLGTAGSLFMLKDKIKSAFFINNCDILIKTDYAGIMKFHKASKNKITIVASMKHFTIPYGVCDINEGGALKTIIEKPEYDYLVNTGMYVLEPECLGAIPENKFYHITDLINKLMKEGKKVGVYPISEKSWLDMGQWEEYHNMLNEFKIK